MLDNFTNGLNNCGVEVVERNDADYAQACGKIAAAALEYEAEDATSRLQARNMAFLTSAKTDWKYFAAHYDEAFKIALSKH